MKILLLGKTGQVGFELRRALSSLGELLAPDRDAVDLERPDTLRKVVREACADVLVNAAAYTAVDKAESEVALARSVNYTAVEVMAEEARRLGAWLVHYSTDYVFDGKQPTPYTEDDPVNPLSVYGQSKLEGEQAIRSIHESHLIFRTSWVFGAWGNNFAKTILRLARQRQELKVVADQHGAPTSAMLLADVTALALYRIFSQGTAATHAGTYNVTAGGETTWYEYARYVLAEAARHGIALTLKPSQIEAIVTEAYPTPAARPKNSRLDTSKLKTIFNLHPPHWHAHVARVVRELTVRDGI